MCDIFKKLGLNISRGIKLWEMVPIYFSFAVAISLNWSKVNFQERKLSLYQVIFGCHTLTHSTVLRRLPLELSWAELASISTKHSRPRAVQYGGDPIKGVSPHYGLPPHPKFFGSSPVQKYCPILGKNHGCQLSPCFCFSNLSNAHSQW